MTGESTSRRETPICPHQWKRVEGAKSAKGGMVCVCELCKATLEPDPPVVEHGPKKKPLLMEGGA